MRLPEVIWLKKGCVPTCEEHSCVPSLTSSCLSLHPILAPSRAKKSSGISIVKLWQASKEMHVKNKNKPEIHWANFLQGRQKAPVRQKSLPAKFSGSAQEVGELCSKMCIIASDRQSKNIFHQLCFRDSQIFPPPRFVLAEAFQIKTNKQISSEVDRQHEKSLTWAVLRSTRNLPAGAEKALPDSSNKTVVWSLNSVFWDYYHWI